MHDRLGNGRNIRSMNIIDDCARECLANEVQYSFSSSDLIAALDLLCAVRGRPETVRFDNGTEFTSCAMLQWAADKGFQLHFIDPGKPMQNAQIESLNGRIRDELMNVHVFPNIFVARRLAEQWKIDYNEIRPHSSLGYQTPSAFALNLEINSISQ